MAAARRGAQSSGLCSRRATTSVDLVPSAESNSPDSPVPFLYSDLTDAGQALEPVGGGDRMPGVEAVVHLAAIPSPVHATPSAVFRSSILSTHAVFAAAGRLGLAIDKARRVLGYEPAFSWRTIL